jgi:hypothetical protein
MDKTDIKPQVLIFEKARNNLLFVIFFTVINLILSVFDAQVTFLFSATLPQVIFEIGKTLASEMENNIFMTVGLIIASIIVSIYFVFWILAKRIRAFILVALIFFSIDSLVLLFLILSAEFSASFLLEIGFHGWILYYLINGVKAWVKMSGVNADVFNAILQEIKSKNPGSTELAVPNEQNKEITEDDNSNNE